ncbi:GNAT family N-acetyltransferase [Sinomonas sp. JGH33]|uniref:GNAT family N-acetyltransferase n=1 Tax=Sinomonas terricola TaxID=3110330 RepID=A0ABU5T2X9_9MICC|nr:GNAT family N-acetyltransferase [Sinomonas sp. JGH33]MEA5453516.1 GNAT family N-acetyltransferase [Sinomonas sp. JGH33]
MGGTFHNGSRGVVRLAWARRLGLPDLAFSDDGARLLGFLDSSAELVAVELFGQLALSGPTELVEAAAKLPDDELLSGGALLRLAGPGAHGLSSAILGFADDLPVFQPEEDPEVSRGNPEAIELASLCPPDDVSSAGIEQREHRFTLMLGSGPAACAAYGVHEGLLADLGVLVAPGLRNRGLGAFMAQLAAHEALAEGYLIQVEAQSQNVAALRLADALGVVPSGRLASVRLRGH